VQKTKRLLSLIFVLVFTSTANALLTAIEIDVDGKHVGPSVNVVTGNTISVEMYSGNTNAGIAYLGFEDNQLYTLSNPRVDTSAHDQGEYSGPYTYGGYLMFEITVSATATSTITPGTMFLVDFTAGSTEGTVDVILWDEYLVTKDSTVINIVPEPMSITLLALGSLTMLRKRHP